MVQQQVLGWLKAVGLCVLFCYMAIPVFCRPQLVIPKTELQEKSGKALFEVLKKWHTDAYSADAELVYPENLVLEIGVPSDAKSIPLSPYTDFNGCRIIVENNAINNFILFSLTSK